MTSNELVVVAGVLLSLLFSYIPGFASWYTPLQADKKRLLMVGFLFLASLGVFLVACSGLMEVGVVCSAAGAFELVKLFVLATIANQATYAVSPQNTKQRETWRDKAEARQGTPGKPRVVKEHKGD